MNFEEKDIALSIDGMGIVFFSPETNKDISEGMNIDLFWLSEWSGECPPEQILSIKPGYYHITLCTKKPDSGIWGDNQTIYVYLNRLDAMPELAWRGAPLLFNE